MEILRHSKFSAVNENGWSVPYITPYIRQALIQMRGTRRVCERVVEDLAMDWVLVVASGQEAQEPDAVGVC